MLFGQDFGRRHERHLLAGLDGLQRRKRGDDRLAGADIALQQPLHRRCALQVMRDFAPHALLRAGQLERCALDQLPRQHTGAGEDRRTAQRPRLAVRLERQLLREQLVELEPRPRRVRARVERALREVRQPRRRRMQETHCVAEFPQLAPGHERLGQRFLRQGRVFGQRARDDLAQRFLRKPGGRRIDGGEPIGERRVLGDDPPLRVHDLETEVAGPHVAEHAHAMTRLQRFLLARIEREEAQHELRVALRRIGDQADELPPRPVLDVRIDDHALGLHGKAGLQRGERRQPRVVLVAQRQMQHEVAIAR